MRSDRLAPLSSDLEVNFLNVRSMAEAYGGSRCSTARRWRLAREGQHRSELSVMPQRAGLGRVTIHAAHGLPAEQIVANAKAATGLLGRAHH